MPAEWTTSAEWRAQGMNQDVPFTSLDSLASVVAAGASHLGRLHGLAVDDGGAGAFVPAGLVPDLGPQGVLDRLPRAIATPLPIVVMDRSPWGKVVGKHPPLDAAADEIKMALRISPVDGLRPPSRFGLGNQGLDQLPLGIGQIGGVCGNSTPGEFCLEALDKGLSLGRPETFDTDFG